MNEKEIGTYLQDIVQRHIDPKNRILLSRFLTLILFPHLFPEHEGDDEEPPEDYEKEIGAMLCSILRHETAEDLEVFCSQLIKLKKKSVELPRREAYAWLALRDYWKEVGRPPSKGELRKFMEARRETY